jgi:hypothetical protein
MGAARDSETRSATLFFLDERESSLVHDALSYVRINDAERADLLDANLERLTRAADLIRTSPSIARAYEGRFRTSTSDFSGETLVEALCRVPDYDLDLHIPTKAVFGQAYLVAKINFFKALGYAVEALSGPADLQEGLQRELGQSVYTKLAEELFISIVTDQDAPRTVKTSAAHALFSIWEDRLLAEIDDFAPILESIWRARNEVRPVLGTMRGTQEFFRLIEAACDERFVDHFSGDGISDEQHQAFEEFLFGISHEEIRKLRDHLANDKAGCVSSEQARTLLGRTGDSWVPSPGPQGLYTSYKRRRVKAHYRALTGASGPKKTAEEYVMIAFLERGVKP